MQVSKLILISLCLITLAFSANKEEWRKRSIYQLLTDRFARNDGQQTACSNLGSIFFKKVTIVEEDIEGLSTI